MLRILESDEETPNSDNKDEEELSRERSEGRSEGGEQTDEEIMTGLEEIDGLKENTGGDHDSPGREEPGDATPDQEENHLGDSPDTCATLQTLAKLRAVRRYTIVPQKLSLNNPLNECKSGSDTIPKEEQTESTDEQRNEEGTE